MTVERNGESSIWYVRNACSDPLEFRDVQFLHATTEPANSFLSSLSSLCFDHARHCRLQSPLPVSFRTFPICQFTSDSATIVSWRKLLACCELILVTTVFCSIFSSEKAQKGKSFHHASATVNWYKQNQQGQISLGKHSTWRTCYKTVCSTAGTSY